MLESTNWTQRRPTLPIAPYVLLPQCAMILVIALRLGLGLRLATWLGMAALFDYAIRFDTGDDFRNYCTGTALGTMLFTALYLVLSDPVATARHETHTTSLAAMPLWKRAYNIACIYVNTRGIGWNYQISHVPPVPAESRTRFIVVRGMRIVGLVLFADAAQTYLDMNPVFALTGDRARSVGSQGVILRALNVVAYGGRSYCALNIAYDALAVIVVAPRLSEPRSWPLLFGSWREAYTVRRFWNRVWQQMMRRFISAWAKLAARALGLAPGTWLSTRAQLFVGFTISGLTHLPGDAMVNPRLAWSSFWFFPLQAVAITFEDFVIALGKECGVRDSCWIRAAGYFWTAAWFTYSVPWFIDWMVKAGLARDRLFPPLVVQSAIELAAPSRALWFEQLQQDISGSNSFVSY